MLKFKDVKVQDYDLDPENYVVVTGKLYYSSRPSVSFGEFAFKLKRNNKYSRMFIEQFNKKMGE